MATPLRSCAALLALLLSPACGGGAEERAAPIHLAELYAPPEALVQLDGGERAYEHRFAIAADAWKAERDEGLWSAPAPWYRLPVPVLVGEDARLVLDGDMALRPAPGRRPADVKQAGTFALVTLEDGDYVFARLPAGTQPAAGQVDVLVSAGAPGRARRAGDEVVRPWRLAGGPLSGDGFLVRSDAPAEMTLDVPPASRLVFDSVCIGRRGEDLTLRVLLDGEVLAELPLSPSPFHAILPHDLDLPADGREAARLTLEIDGDAWCALYGARIAPAATGGEPPARPDVIVFLADTFRADNMAFYGGEAGVTPALDAFAQDCLGAEQVWAPACWTLPSHASMFLGVDPMQHGATGPRLTPVDGLVSIAEKLQSAGYRTAAVTDSLFVSRRFSLDRGFEHFEEYSHRDLERTLRRAREITARDDGRPLFLFVHTYRTHEPYEASPETRAELGDRLGIGPTWDELEARVFEEILKRHEAGDPEAKQLMKEGDLHELLVRLGLLDLESPEGDKFLRAIRALYLGGVRDLDRAFGEFLADVDARDRDAWLVFTSDHGEAFGEHQSIFHGYGALEENLRVPLLIRGPGLEPRTLTHPASLIDLPQTLAEMAGIAPDPAWGGASLLSLAADRAIFAFDCAQRGDPHGAIIDNGLKVIFEPDEAAVRAGIVTQAFDLVADPDELDDLGAAPRATSVLERLVEDVLERMQPLAEPGTAELNETQLQQMEKMGYAGAGDD